MDWNNPRKKKTHCITQPNLFFQNAQLDLLEMLGKFTAKRCVCCPRPGGNNQREAKKCGQRENFVHWGSW